VKHGLLDTPVLYLSRYINQNKSEYYRLLQVVRDHQDWEKWVLYMLEGLEQTSHQTTRLILGMRDLWKKEYSECLQNAHVLLFYDYDQAGAQHRDNIITQLQGYAASIQVIHLPGFEIQDKHGLDVTDWLQRGHTFSELEKLIQDAPLINFFSPSKTEADRIKAVSAEELIEMKIEQPETLLHPFITKSSLGMIYAQRGIGKTFFTLSLGMAVASGGQFLKFSAPKPYKVLYLDGEMSIFSMQDRISKAYSSQKNKPPKNHFKLVNAFLQDLPLPDLATSEGQRALQPLINDSDLIIGDNLSCWVTSGAENEGESWLPILQWALKQRRQGKAVIFIHHSNKKNGQRGSSRKEDALDYVIKLDNWSLDKIWPQAIPRSYH
jgi:hypothetical protein